MTYRGTIAYRSNSGAQIPEGFAASFIQAWDFLCHQYTESREHWWNFHFMRGLSCMVDESANQIADQFLGDWVLMLDTDHVFAADAFYEMVTTFEENKLDVLVGFTQKRVPPYHPVLYKTDGFNAMLDFKTIFPNPMERHQLIEIDSSGCSCLMVRRKVFEEIKLRGERPFDRRRKFNSAHLGDWSILNETFNVTPKGRWIDEAFGEDTSFFWRAQMLGFKAYCAAWIKFHHLSTIMVTEDMLIPPPPPEIPR